MNLVDTSGWLEYFFDGPTADRFAPAIECAAELIVPTICQYEVFKKLNLVADEHTAFLAIAQMRQGQVIDVTEEIALMSATISIQQGLAMADSIIYAAAKKNNAILWTKDADFKGLPNVSYIAPA